MSLTTGALGWLVVYASFSNAQGVRPPRKCEAASAAEACHWIKGRLSFANGTPALRLWIIGSNHLLGIHSDAYGLSKPDLLDNENPMLPDDVNKILGNDRKVTRVQGDFLVCPLEPTRSGSMQAACVQRARNLHKAN